MLLLETLPAELVLRVLAYLTVQSLRNLRLASRAWNTFFTENESSIYHQASLLHNFIDSIHTLLSEAKETHPLKFLQDLPDWYQYCRKYFQLQRNWLGAGNPRARFYGNHPHDVHRIKVDEEHGFLITTHQFGGLTVFDLDTTQIIWRLDATHVRQYAHCEYDNGFLIFDRPETYKEVWRLEKLCDVPTPPSCYPPDEAQMDAWRTVSREYAATGSHGHFRPWALIQCPDVGRAFRFVYPTLLVCGQRRAFLWNVPTPALIMEIHNVQGHAAEEHINYVEMSARHVFVCSTSALRIFSREDGALVLKIPSYQFVYADVRLAVQLDPAIARQKAAGPAEAVRLPSEVTASTALYNASYAEFSAVHVSRSGKDIVAQLSDSRLYVVHDFERVVRGEISLTKAAFECGKILPRLNGAEEHFAIYHALEHGRVGIATTSGLYVATLDITHHGFFDEDLVLMKKKFVSGVPISAIQTGVSFPYLVFVSLPFYHHRQQLAKVTCIQITETKLYFVWDAMYKPENIEFFRSLGMIDGNTSSPRGDDDLDGIGLYVPPENASTLSALDSDSEPDDDEEYLDAPASYGSQASGVSGSGAVSDDMSGAGSSSGLVAPYDEVDDAEDNQDDAEGHEDGGGFDNLQPALHDGPLTGGGLHRDHDIHSTGPIVFCIDFSPE